MIRILPVVVSVLIGGATGAVAQTHSQSHHQGRPHDSSGHAPMDPAQHAALHGLIDGEWQGTLKTPAGESGALTLKVSKDSRGADVFDMTGAPSLHIGAATQLAVEHHNVRWVQDVLGAPCRVSADVVDAAAREPKSLKGTMACSQGDLTFTLAKTTR